MKTPDELVQQIYAAVSDLGSWDAVLRDIAHVTGATYGAFFWRDEKYHEHDIMAVHNLPSEYISRYTEHYHTVDEWINGGASILKPGWVGWGQELCPDAKLEKSEFGSDFLSKFDVFHQMGAIVSQQGDLKSLLTLLRPKRRRAFEQKSVATVGALMPHLQQALAVRRKVLTLEVQKDLLEHTVSRSSIGTIFVAHDLRVIWMNNAAKRILDKKRAICLKAGNLVAAHQGDNSQLQNAVRLAQPRRNHVGAPSVVVIGEPLQRSISISIAPAKLKPFTESGAAAVLLLSNTDDNTVPVDVLRSIFKLTATEAKLTARLARGEELKAVCGDLSISYATGRAHLRNIFQKTGVSRQPELVSLVLRLSQVQPHED